MNTFLVYYVLIWFTVQCVEGQGKIPPVGVTSIKKCGEYYGLKLPKDIDKFFSPPTKEELDAIHKEELKYPPVSYALGQYGLLKQPIFVAQKGFDATYNARYEGLVAGGQNALEKQLPFMAALGYDNGGRKQYVCGGTLISEQFVVTAAHCIYSEPWGRVNYVRLGDLNVTNTFDDEGAQEYQIKEVHVHPSYHFPVQYNDIALIKLDRPVVFTGFVSPACLEPKRVEIRYLTFYIAGWGRLGFDKELSSYLQFGLISHYPGLECQKNFPRKLTLPEGVKHESQICAGTYTSIIDTCKGDSGGPLAYKRFTSPNNFVYMIAGITSFGKPCGIQPNIPAIYTRVSYYTDWIERMVWPNEFGDSASPVGKSEVSYSYAFNPYVFNPYVLNPYAQYFPDSSFGSFSYFK